MFVYEKRLQYPVKIKNTNPKLASVIISQYGGPDILHCSTRLQTVAFQRFGAFLLIPQLSVSIHIEV